MRAASRRASELVSVGTLIEKSFHIPAEQCQDGVISDVSGLKIGIVDAQGVEGVEGVEGRTAGLEGRGGGERQLPG